LSILATALPACSKKEASKQEPAGSGASAAKPAEASADNLAAALPKHPPAQFEAWDMPARAKAWQGAWVSEEVIGFPIALEVKGTKVTQWDGKAEKHLEFSLESPCSASLAEKSPDGSSSSTISHFTVKDGKLIEGLGDAGTRKGKSAIACMSNRIVTLDDAGTCTFWRPSMFDKYDSEPGKCGFVQKDGKEVFVATIDGHDSELLIDGDALLSEQLKTRSSKSYPDLAAAKAARDAAKP
jgi:hypothetical protein